MTAALPPSLPEGSTHVHLAEVDSTNAEAMRRVMAGDRGPLWITADRQRAGRGRSGRAWASSTGNLFASHVVAIDALPINAGQLSLVSGVAVADAIARAGARAIPGLRLKWPNDILIGSAKSGGILIESSMRPGIPGAMAVIGVGLNLTSAPDDLGRSVTFLAQHGLSLSPAEALCFLAQTMNEWMTIWDNGAGFERVRQAWLARAGSIGESLTVNALSGPVAGGFAGLDPGGALLLDVPGQGTQAFSFGDVTLNLKDDNA